MMNVVNEERYTEWMDNHTHGAGLAGKDCYTKLAKLEDLIEQKTLIYTYANIGDAVFSVEYDKVIPMTLREIRINCDGEVQAFGNDGIFIGVFGDTVFTESGEAKEALILSLKAQHGTIYRCNVGGVLESGRYVEYDDLFHPAKTQSEKNNILLNCRGPLNDPIVVSEDELNDYFIEL